MEVIPARVAAAGKVSKPVMCNLDPRTGEDGARSLQSAVDASGSWGFANPANEKYPFKFDGPKDDPIVYAKFKEVSSPAK